MSKGRPVDDNYSLNQCCMVIRIDGDELYLPLNFNMTADEIREIYPYLLQMCNNRIANPSLEFESMVRRQGYRDMTQDEYDARLKASQEASRLWYGKADASLLAIALRLCVDLKLRGVEELRHLFDSTAAKPMKERLEVKVEDMPKGLGKLSSEEARQVLIDNGLLTPTDEKFDPGTEQDVPLGVAGDNAVNLYNSGGEAEYMGAELDAREQRLALEDRFRQVAAHGGDPVPEGDPPPATTRPSLDAKASGPISLYGGTGEEEGILDRLDRQDGLSPDDVKYEYDYEMGAKEAPVQPAPTASGSYGFVEVPEMPAGDGGYGDGLDGDDGYGGDNAPDFVPASGDEGGLPLGAVDDEDDGADGGPWDPEAEDAEAEELRREEGEEPDFDDLEELMGGRKPVDAPPDGDGDGYL